MGAYDDMSTKSTEDVVSIMNNGNDSYLHMRAYKTDDGAYTTTKSVTTSETMTFLYGYLEMRAKLPTGKGVWPSLWLQSNVKNESMRDTLGYNPNLDYDAEVDIFEIFSSANIVPNLHKWWRTTSAFYSESNQRVQYNGCTNYAGSTGAMLMSKELTVSDGNWHTYGMLWTENRIDMYVDGTCYMTYSLNSNFGDGDMSGFHTPLYIIMNNHLFTPGYTNSAGGAWAKTHCLDSDTFTESIYDVDYIKLYQKPGMKIYTAGT